eukprot:889403-Pleurochrysis_carterae.AAC.1
MPRTQPTAPTAFEGSGTAHDVMKREKFSQRARKQVRTAFGYFFCSSSEHASKRVKFATALKLQ